MKFRFMHRRLTELDARVEDSQRRAEEAAQEAEASEQRKKKIEQNVVEPLRQAGAHNQFAELIRQSLIIGSGNHNHRGNEAENA